MQVNQIANNLEPELLGDSKQIDSGAPTLAADGKTIIGGNGRVMAIHQAYQQGNGEHYRQYLMDNAEQFGLSPADIRAMGKPVLVRRFTDAGIDTNKAAVASNEGGGLGMSALEQARVDAERLPDFGSFVPSENGELNTPANRGFIRDFVGSMPTTVQAQMIGADGQLSQDGVRRLRNALLYRAYGNSPALSRMVESTDAGLKNMVNAMMQAAPAIAKAKNHIKDGAMHDADISADIVAAVEKINEIHEGGGSVADYLAQQGMFEDDLSPVARDLIAFFDEHKRSAKAISTLLKNYYDLLAAQGNPAEADMFGGAQTPDKHQLLQESIKNYEQQHGRQEQRGIFDRAEPTAAAQSERRPAGESVSDTQPQPDSGGVDEAGVGENAGGIGERQRVGGADSDGLKQERPAAGRSKSRPSEKKIFESSDKLGFADQNGINTVRTVSGRETLPMPDHYQNHEYQTENALGRAMSKYWKAWDMWLMREAFTEAQANRDTVNAQAFKRNYNKAANEKKGYAFSARGSVLSESDRETATNYLFKDGLINRDPFYEDVELEDGGGKFSRSAMKDIQANIRRGREAMNRAILEKADQHRAMYRNDIGWVDFVWGDDGTTRPRNPKGEPIGKGIAHIIEARQRKDGMTYQQAVQMLSENIVETIAKGQTHKHISINNGKAEQLQLRYDGYQAVLVKNAGNNAWLLTGFELYQDGAGRVGFDTSAATHETPTLTRHSVGASDTETNIPQSDQKHIETIQQAITDALGAQHARLIDVVSLDDISRPDNAEDLLNAQGWYDTQTGRITLIADNLPNADTAKFVAWHESAHRKIHVEGFDKWSALLRQADGNTAVKSLADAVMKQRRGYRDSAAANRIAAVEEAIAELYAAKQENNLEALERKYGISLPAAFKDGLGGYLARVAERIKNILKDALGIGRDAFSDGQVFGLLRRIDAVKPSEKGAEPLAENGLPPQAEGAEPLADDTRYSLSEDAQSDFARAVDDAAAGKPVKGYVGLGTTPDALKVIGLPDVKVTMHGSAFKKVMGGKHNLNAQTLKQLPAQLNNPVAVMNSSFTATKQDGYVVLTELIEHENGKDKPVIAALHLNKTASGIEVLNIASVYGRRLNQIQQGLDNELLYWNKEKGLKFLKTFGLQLPAYASSDSALSNSNIKTEADLAQDESKFSRYSDDADKVERAAQKMGLYTNRESSRASASEYVYVALNEDHYDGSAYEDLELVKVRVSNHALPSRHYELGVKQFDVFPRGGSTTNSRGQDAKRYTDGSWADAVAMIAEYYGVKMPAYVQRIYDKEKAEREELERRIAEGMAAHRRFLDSQAEKAQATHRQRVESVGENIAEYQRNLAFLESLSVTEYKRSGTRKNAVITDTEGNQYQAGFYLPQGHGIVPADFGLLVNTLKGFIAEAEQLPDSMKSGNTSDGQRKADMGKEERGWFNEMGELRKGLEAYNRLGKLIKPAAEAVGLARHHWIFT